MKWLMKNVAITVGMAVARRAWRAYQGHRAAGRAAGSSRK